jgi:hypothetical protein
MARGARKAPAKSGRAGKTRTAAATRRWLTASRSTMPLRVAVLFTTPQPIVGLSVTRQPIAESWCGMLIRVTTG